MLANKLARNSLMILLVLSGWGMSNGYAQDYDSWRNAVDLQYGDDPAIIRHKYVDITFDRKRKADQPEVYIRYSYKIAPVRSKNILPFTILLDSHTTLKNIRSEGRKIKISRIKLSDYTDGNLIHTDIRTGTFNVHFGKRFRDRKFSYTVKVDDIRYLSPLYFHERYAIYESNIRVRIPQWLNMDVIEYNMDDSLKYMREREVNSKLINLNYHSYSFEPGSSDMHMPPPSYIYPHLLFISKSYSNRQREQFSIISDLKDLYDWYRYILESVDNQSFTVDNYLQNVISSLEDPQRKMEAIYYWVKENIRYLAFEKGLAGYQPQDARTVYENRYGDCKAMANLTKHLLIKAGLDARLTWLGSKYLNYNYDHPALTIDNHMICAVLIDGQYHYLDPTEASTSIGRHTDNIAGRQVLIEHGDNYILQRIPELNKEDDLRTIIMQMSLDRDEILKGSVSMSSSGSAKYDLMNNFMTSTNRSEELKHSLHLRDQSDIQFSESDWNSWKSKDTIIHLDFNLAVRNAGAAFGDEIYVDMNQLSLTIPPLIKANRKYDYVINDNWRTQLKIYLSIPSGYTISYVPSALQLSDGPVAITLNVQ